MLLKYTCFPLQIVEVEKTGNAIKSDCKSRQKRMELDCRERQEAGLGHKRQRGETGVEEGR